MELYQAYIICTGLLSNEIIYNAYIQQVSFILLASTRPAAANTLVERLQTLGIDLIQAKVTYSACYVLCCPVQFFCLSSLCSRSHTLTRHTCYPSTVSCTVHLPWFSTDSLPVQCYYLTVVWPGLALTFLVLAVKQFTVACFFPQVHSCTFEVQVV